MCKEESKILSFRSKRITKIRELSRRLKVSKLKLMYFHGNINGNKDGKSLGGNE
jgi:hypothetical protein